MENESSKYKYPANLKNLIYKKPSFDIMKELDIIVPHERLNDVNGILHKHNLEAYILARLQDGVAQRGEVEQLVAPDRYKTGERYIPEFGSRTKITVIVPDSMEKQLTDEIIGAISTGSAGNGKIFVKDISGAYDIGSKQSGEKAAL